MDRGGGSWSRGLRCLWVPCSALAPRPRLCLCPWAGAVEVSSATSSSSQASWEGPGGNSLVWNAEGCCCPGKEVPELSCVGLDRAH